MIDEPEGRAGLELPTIVQIKRIATDVLVVGDYQSLDFADTATVDDAFGSEQSLAYGGASDAQSAFGQGAAIGR